jgi:putative nucleotidyltransferase with HDIG domain
MGMRFNIFRPRKNKVRPVSPPMKNARQHTRFFGFMLAIFLWVAVLFLMHSGESRRYSNLAVGQRAPATVVATADFSCEDVARTELNRRQMADAILPVFTINYNPYNSATRTLDKLYDRISQFRQTPDSGATLTNLEIQVSDVLDLLGLSISPEDALRLAPAGQEQVILALLKDSLKKVWMGGIVSLAERETLFQGVASSGQILITEPDEGVQITCAVSNLVTPEEGIQKVIALVSEKENKTNNLPKQALSDLLKTWMRANLNFDAHTTNEKRAQASKDIEAATMMIRAGTTLVEEKERITPQILEMIQAHEKRLAELESPRDRFMKIAGTAGLVLAFLLISIGFLQLAKPEVLHSDSKTLLLVVLSLLSLLACKGVLYLSNDLRLFSPWLVEYLLPLSLAPLLASILMGGTVAIALGLWNSLITAILFNSNIVFATSIVVTVVAALATRAVRRRTHIVRAGFSIGIVNVLLVLSFAALNQQTLPVMASQAIAGLIGGLVTALIVTLLIPVFEISFGITTDLTLLELSDMGHPLLQRLAMEAPGTYHHCLMVANLGQAAAQEVGANALLVRICAYYHDIGKLSKPEFYSENTHLRENPHDDLSPSMSTLVILSHVKEGVGLVQRYKLPKLVADAIEQHHGTGLISYFYHRAKQLQEAGQSGGPKANGRSINEQDFRYPGPKPQTPENAILLLADAVEAASRSMEKPTPTRVENLVSDIVAGKLADGQLDECHLTLAQLNIIKRSFVFSLTNMLHGRTSYLQDENKSSQSTNKIADTPVGTPAPRALDTISDEYPSIRS